MLKRRSFIKMGSLALGATTLRFSAFTQLKPEKMTTTNQFEVIIIGGSYAGQSAALTLGRSLRSTLLIDAGQPCNRTAPHAHNFLTHDGIPPATISEIGRKQLTAYSTVHFHQDLANKVVRNNKGFTITTANGHTFAAKKLVLATGIKDLLPDIAGFADSWGKSVVHCPYCHGYEHKGKSTGLLMNGEKALHLAPLVNHLASEVVILTNGKAEFSEEEQAKLKKNAIPVIEKKVNSIQHREGEIEEVVFEDGSKLKLEALYASVPFEQHSDIAAQLDCALSPSGHLEVDHFQQTSVDDVFACGDNTNPMRSIAAAVSSGNIAGAIINMQLAQAEF
jgi:thioredoxin reductase